MTLTLFRCLSLLTALCRESTRGREQGRDASHRKIRMLTISQEEMDARQALSTPPWLCSASWSHIQHSQFLRQRQQPLAIPYHSGFFFLVYTVPFVTKEGSSGKETDRGPRNSHINSGEPSKGLNLMNAPMGLALGGSEVSPLLGQGESESCLVPCAAWFWAKTQR